jgi:molybdate transport system substrate-binding protein
LTRFVLLAALAVLAGCGGEDESKLVVLAASSLRGVADRIDPEAEVAFGGSNDLAAQIRDGADAGIFLSAGEKPLDELVDDGAVEAPVPFASNRLVIVIPAGSEQVTRLRDLARPGVKLVLGAAGVPVGDYAREALGLAGLEASLDNVVSLEDDVAGVVGKVALGEADAGIVYATDVRAVAGDVRPLPVPERFQPRIAYHAALVSPASDAAKRYLARLLGTAGQAVLRDRGFLPARG